MEGIIFPHSIMFSIKRKIGNEIHVSMTCLLRHKHNEKVQININKGGWIVYYSWLVHRATSTIGYHIMNLGGIHGISLWFPLCHVMSIHIWVTL